MYSSDYTNPVFPLVLVLLVLLLNSCSERSEYGEAGDYEKLGAPCIASASADVTAPTVSYVSPIDNSTYNSPATTVAVTFSENIETGSVTTNISDTICSGSFQLSSDNFTTCIKMSAAPVASDNDTTFTITPASSLSATTTFKVKITTSVTDISCNTLGSDNKSIVGFSTSPSGSGTISGSVQSNNTNSYLSGVGISWGSTVATTTSDSNGDFSQASLSLGMHSVTYSKSGYLSLTLTELLETDGETLNLETVKLLDEDCTSGTMSGKITNAVTGDNMSGVDLWYIKGKNKRFAYRQGTFFGQTADNGSWTLPNSNCSPAWRCGDHYNTDERRWVKNDITSPTPGGWYTILSEKSGYYQGYHDAKSCGNQANQNNSLSATMNEGEMRIILRWPKTNPVTGKDLDSHLSIPNKDDNGTVHIWYGTNAGGVSANDYYVYGANDNVTLDKDHNDDSSPASPPGDETITITKVRSGTYSYSVHNYTERLRSTSSPADNLSKSNAKVEVIYNKEGTLVRKRFYAPSDNGTLWGVFTFDSSGSGDGFTRVDNMSYEATNSNIY
ncbi:MAG: hypothetical protein HOK56_09145 [Deltaproteobacteria bacterium]|nr:hypothetical protein [Deltaproteobacteria bacterium]